MCGKSCTQKIKFKWQTLWSILLKSKDSVLIDPKDYQTWDKREKSWYSTICVSSTFELILLFYILTYDSETLTNYFRKKNSLIEWITWTFQWDLNDVMAWKVGEKFPSKMYNSSLESDAKQEECLNLLMGGCNSEFICQDLLEGFANGLLRVRVHVAWVVFCYVKLIYNKSE